MRFPRNAIAQKIALNASLIGAKGNELRWNRLVSLDSSHAPSIARNSMISPTPTATRTEGFTASQRTGHTVGLLMMLKKNGPGWQTRIVRAQRIWCCQTDCHVAADALHSTVTGQIEIRPPACAIRFPS